MASVILRFSKQKGNPATKITFTVTPVYDGKQGVDIKKQFEKCVINNATDLNTDDSGGTIT